MAADAFSVRAIAVVDGDGVLSEASVQKSNQVNFAASRGSFLESTPCSCRTKPPDVVVGFDRTATRWVAGWRGRIRTFDLLIQSQTPDSGLASHRVSVPDSNLCPIPG
jgi:hypothetical protein